MCVQAPPDGDERVPDAGRRRSAEDLHEQRPDASGDRGDRRERGNPPRPPVLGLLKGFTRYVELFFAGFADILPVLAILLASFMIKTACGEMGLSEYVINLCVPYMNAKTLAAIIFVVIAVLTFVTSSFWGIEAVAVSIVVPLAIALDANVLLALGAVVSGGVFGSHACFYSDATVLSSATCEIDNMSHAVSQFPYVLISAALAVAGFLICGIFAL